MDLGSDWIKVALAADFGGFVHKVRDERATDALFEYVITNQKSIVLCPECSFTQGVA